MLEGLILLSEVKEIIRIPIEDITPNPYQPRKDFNKSNLVELSESIKQYGILQPINVRKIGDSGYELVAGERRLRAAKLAGLKEIPAIIIEIIEQDSAIISLIENLQREDLNFFDEAEGYYNLINDHGLTQEELARKVGKNQSTVANKIRLLKLPDTVRKGILEHGLTERHARALLKLPDDKTREKVLKNVIKESLNVKRTEDIIEKLICEAAVDMDIQGGRRIKGKMQYNIYVNTFRNVYRQVIKSGFKMQYNQVDKGDYVEIKLTIPKK